MATFAEVPGARTFIVNYEPAYADCFVAKLLMPDPNIVTDPARLLPPGPRENLFLDPRREAIQRFAAGCAVNIRLGLTPWTLERLVVLERQHGWAVNASVQEVPCS